MGSRLLVLVRRGVGVWIPGVLLIAAALLKAADPVALADVAVAVGLPGTAGAWGAVVVVGVEAALGCALLCTGGRTPRIATMAFLLFSCIALDMLLATADPPACRCFGAIRVFESERGELWAGLGRNALLVAGVLWDMPGARPTGT
jgi:hypothetical protein